MSTHLLPRPSEEFPSGRLRYVEQFGSTLAMNAFLKVMVALEALLCLGLLALTFKAQERLGNVKPLVVRIDPMGRAEPLRYDTARYEPQDREVRYFLTQFVQQHYSRRRATVRELYARSLYFLDGRLADVLMEANKKGKVLETFLAGDGEEIDINVVNVAIEELRAPPYKASVDFEKVYFGPDRTEIRREKYSAHFEFVIKDRVSNAMIPINPLGITITYFRQDQAFQ